MASVPNGVETLPKISIAWVGRTNVTDRRQTKDRREFTFAKKKELENVALATALQLEAARATPALSRFNYDAVPNLKSLNLSIAVL